MISSSANTLSEDLPGCHGVGTPPNSATISPSLPRQQQPFGGNHGNTQVGEIEAIEKTKPLTWVTPCALALLISCGFIFWFSEYKRQGPLRAQWRAYLQTRGNLPAAGPGEIVVRTVPGDDKNQWKIYLRCGESCKVDLNVAKGVFHRSEMQPLDSFHSVSRLRQTPSICWCVEGLVTTIEVSLDQRSDSSWELTIDGLYSLRVALDAGDNPIGAGQWQFAGADEATTFAMSKPIRLFDIELPHADNSRDLMMMSGVCVYARVEPTEL